MLKEKIQELSRKEMAYEFIKHKIINCEMKPGSDISEEELVRALGSSRTPVREALMSLKQEGFVNIFPRKGSFVTEVTLKEIQDIFEIRVIIETQVAKMICGSISEKELISFRNKFEQLDESGYYHTAKDYFELDLEFHKRIVKSTENSYLIEFMNKIYDKDYRIRVITTTLLKDEKKRNKEEHINIINSILEKDEEKIQESFVNHIENTKRAALKIMLLD